MEEDNNNEELENDEAQEPQEQEGQSSSSSNLIRDEAKNQAQKQIKKEMSKAVTKNAAKHSALAALGPILFWVAIIIVIIIIIVGIVMFLVTMPGMLMDQLKALSKEVADAFSAFFGGDKTTQVGDEEIYEVLDYLEQMGVDLKGSGYLTDYLTESNYLDDVDNGKKDNATFDSKNGVTRDDNEKIINAESDFVFTYLVSDNYVYTIANYNQVTTNEDDDYKGLSGALRRIAAGGQAVWRKISNVVLNDGYDWGKGLINISYEEGDEVGEIGEYLGSSLSDSLFKWVGAKINTDEDPPTLEIRRGWGANTMKYSLDGWTGRYGMPLEFLLTIHQATLMPDLAYDMAKSFDTKINILFRNLEGTAVGAYKLGDIYISYDDIKNLVGDPLLGLSATEAKEVMDTFHIPSPENCDYYQEVANQSIDESQGESEIDSYNFDIFTTMDDTISAYNGMVSNLQSKYGCNALSTISTGSEFDALLTEEGDSAENFTNGELVYYLDNINNTSYYFYNYDTNKKILRNYTWTYGEGENQAQYNLELNMFHKKFLGIADFGLGNALNYAKDGIEFGDYDDFGEYLKTSADARNYEFMQITYKLTKGASKKELEDAGVESEQELKCSNTDINNEDHNDKCCNACRDYIRKIYSKIKEADVSKFKTYQPYIANVNNHWYRDVYFIKTDEDFVVYDYDYEATTRERWTLYETDENGDYIYYIVDDHGNYLTNSDGTYKKYTGKITKGEVESTSKDGEKTTIRVSATGANGEKLAKKAVTLGSNKDYTVDEQFEDLNWKKNGQDNWTAYEITQGATTIDYAKAYEEDPENPDEIENNIYAKVVTNNNISQTGEGQRTETNSTIKDMFLNRRYFRYDGSAETAEIITKIRKENNLGYGPLSGDKAKIIESTYVDSKGNKVNKNEENAKPIKDYTGQVSLEQDALTQSSMLENTHTLDADYIYRDFKELIVELGYYEKEELREEPPRLLQFIVPDIGSYGYPNRAIDKREEEFGTMVHSEGDIKANEKNTLKEMIKKIRDSESPEVTSQNANNFPTSGHRENTAKISTSSNTNLTTVGEIETQSGRRPEDVSVEEFLTATKEVHTVIENLKFQYCWGAGNTHNSDNPHTDGHGCAGLFNTLQEASGSGGHRIDCSTFVSYCLQAVGLMEGRTYTGSKGGGDGLYGLFSEYVISREEAGELQPGDILISDSHTQINGEDHYQYNAGSGDAIRNPPYQEESPSFYTDVIRLPFNNKKSSSGSGAPYEGFKGNEAVVSPVTGILLEYDYYDGEKSNVDNEEYRVNVDLKYGNKILDNTSNKENQKNKNESQNIGVIKSDHVGYAKIKVLDDETYKKIEAELKGKTRWSGDKSFLTNTGNYRDIENLTEDEVDKEWSDIDKTLYGYKEFAEDYKDAGIDGNIIIINGFSCELPDEEFDNEDTKSQLENSPKGEKLKLSSFEKTTTNSFNSEGNIEDEEDLLDSLYEKDDEYKMASKRATEKLNAEIAIKDEAASSMYVKSIRLIKEGTVIGRTLTDRELVVDYRKENYSDYRKENNNEENNNNEEKNNEEESEDKVIGNYLDIIMINGKDEVVENVEDYMKLDTGEEENNKGQADHFSVIDTVLSEDDWVEKAYAYVTKYLPNNDGTFTNKENLREMYKMCKEKGVNPEFIFARGVQESGYQGGEASSNGTNYWGYSTPNDSSGVWNGGSWQNTLGLYCDLIISYQTPETGPYKAIVQRYNERKACTENGGIDPNGYGEPNSLQGIQSYYSWLGDNHLATTPGGGGMYYLYPWRWTGSNEYEGENKIIFESKQEFESLCGSKHGTSGGNPSSTPTTVWEQGMYTAWQSKKVIKIAKEAFGELAGTHDP